MQLQTIDGTQSPTNQFSPNNSKLPKPPPIVFHHKLENHLVADLKQEIKGRMEIKYTSNNTNIFIYDHEEREKYQKHHAFVLRGFQGNPDIEIIRQELATHKLKISNVFSMSNTNNPLFLVVFEDQTTSQFLLKNIQFVYYTRIIWESHRNSTTESHRSNVTHANNRVTPLPTASQTPHV